MSKPRYVVFEQTGEKRIVKGDCAVCFPGRQVRPGGQFVVSPAGIAHHGLDGGDTACGKNATGDKWWWPT